MSAYFMLVCHSRRETIDPEYVGCSNPKRSGVAHGQAGRILAHAMVNRWAGEEVLALNLDNEEAAERVEAYVDVTEAAVEAYNVDKFPDAPRIGYRGVRPTP